MDSEILKKLMSFCAKKERGRVEIKKQLAKLGVEESDEEAYFYQLEQENFFDEDRYLESAIKNKVLINRWGRNKVFDFLEAQEVNMSKIEKAWVDYLDRDLYIDNFLKDKSYKENQLAGEEDARKHNVKLCQYLASKGYETELFEDLLNDL